MNNPLLTPYSIGSLTLKNRIVMAPMTRCRSQQPGNIPTPLNALYYAQRASAGLIVTEATQISADAQGYPWTPGIHSLEQIDGWRLVSDAVHDAGGLIFMQIWHVGRISHSTYRKGAPPVAPSNIAPATGQAMILNQAGNPTFAPFEPPRALSIEDIQKIVLQFQSAAQNALSAGMDGIEIHAANGYLIDQFLSSRTNHRTDVYGGHPRSRLRFLEEVLEATVKVCPGHRIGVRISPLGSFNDMQDDDPETLFGLLSEMLNRFDLAYLHVVDPRFGGHEGSEAAPGERAISLMKIIRSNFQGNLMVCGSYDARRGEEVLRSHEADLVAFGRPFIANPDLVTRIQAGAPLQQADPKTFYGGGKEGYVDYPAFCSESEDFPGDSEDRPPSANLS